MRFAIRVDSPRKLAELKESSETAGAPNNSRDAPTYMVLPVHVLRTNDLPFASNGLRGMDFSGNEELGTFGRAFRFHGWSSFSMLDSDRANTAISRGQIW